MTFKPVTFCVYNSEPFNIQSQKYLKLRKKSTNFATIHYRKQNLEGVHITLVILFKMGASKIRK